MCHWIAQNGGGVRRWRPEAGTCGPDMTYSGAKSRSGPQMFLNKGQTEKIKQQLPVREGCGDVGLFARAVGLGCPQKRLVLRISSRKTGRCPHQHPILRISGGKTGFRPHLDLILRIHLGKRQGVGQQLPVREACGGVGLFACAVGVGGVRGRGEIGNCYRLVPERRQGAAGQALFAWTGAALSPPANDEGAGLANDGKVKADE